MNNIILFKSKKHILVEENYNEFIKFCRYQLSGLTQTQDWEQYAWKGYVTFRKIGIGNKIFDSIDAMHEDYINFAKAYIRYQHTLKAIKKLWGYYDGLAMSRTGHFAGSEHWSHL